MSQLPNFICHRECQFFIALEGAVRKIALTQAKLTLFIAFPRKGCSGGFLNIGVILEDRALVLDKLCFPYISGTWTLTTKIVYAHGYYGLGYDFKIRIVTLFSKMTLELCGLPAVKKWKQSNDGLNVYYCVKLFVDHKCFRLLL